MNHSSENYRPTATSPLFQTQQSFTGWRMVGIQNSPRQHAYIDTVQSYVNEQESATVDEIRFKRWSDDTIEITINAKNQYTYTDLKKAFSSAPTLMPHVVQHEELTTSKWLDVTITSESQIIDMIDLLSQLDPISQEMKASMLSAYARYLAGFKQPQGVPCVHERPALSVKTTEEQSLLKATINKDPEDVLKALQRGANPNGKNDNGFFSLLAVIHDRYISSYHESLAHIQPIYLKMMKYLLDYGADPHAEAIKGINKSVMEQVSICNDETVLALFLPYIRKPEFRLPAASDAVADHARPAESLRSHMNRIEFFTRTQIEKPVQGVKEVSVETQGLDTVETQFTLHDGCMYTDTFQACSKLCEQDIDGLYALYDLNFNVDTEDKKTHFIHKKLGLGKESNRPVYIDIIRNNDKKIIGFCLTEFPRVSKPTVHISLAVANSELRRTRIMTLIILRLPLAYRSILENIEVTGSFEAVDVNSLFLIQKAEAFYPRRRDLYEPEFIKELIEVVCGQARAAQFIEGKRAAYIPTITTVKEEHRPERSPQPWVFRLFERTYRKGTRSGVPVIFPVNEQTYAPIAESVSAKLNGLNLFEHAEILGGALSQCSNLDAFQAEHSVPALR